MRCRNEALHAQDQQSKSRQLKKQDDVSGLTSNTLMAITRLRCGKFFTLVVMVAGSNSEDTKVVLSELLHEIPKHIPNL